MKLNKLTIDCNNTEYIIITNKKINLNYTLKIDENILKQKNTSIKYLGVIIDESFCWKPQIHKACSKLSGIVEHSVTSGKLRINPQKSTAIIISPISNKPVCTQGLTILYDGSVIEISKSTKYLGVIIDDNLLFKTHI